MTNTDLLQLTKLDAHGRGIADLTGLEHAVNLTWLDLHDNQLSDVSPLAGLTNLERLHLNDNQLVDVSPLASLTNLTWLDLAGNQISDISPLSNLVNLIGLRISHNQISDISPLSSLTDLEGLSLDGNRINDLSSLSSLTDLKRLDLGGGNQISDLRPLSALTKLEWLNVSGNHISDVSPLSGLSNLITLGLYNNQVSDVSPLLGLSNLEELSLGRNPLSDASLGLVQALRRRGVEVTGVPLLVPDMPNRPHALSLDGEGDYVQTEAQDAYDLPVQVTMEAWVFIRSFGDQKIVSKRPAYVLAITADRKAETEIFTDGTSYDTRTVPGGTVLEEGRWYHLAGTYDGRVIKTYVNGKLDRSLEHVGDIDVVSFPLRLGETADGSGYGFNGLLDEVRVWRIARTQEEIQAAMNRPLTQEEIDSGHLIGYWNFEDGTARDLSPIGNHGRLVGDAGILPLVEPWPPVTAGDVSGDGTVSALDASLILQYVVGLIGEFPAETLRTPGVQPSRRYTVRLPRVEAHEGERVTVPIQVASSGGLVAGGLVVRYDPSRVRAVDFRPTRWLNGYYWQASVARAGEVRLAFLNLDSGGEAASPTDASLLEVRFEVLRGTLGETIPLVVEKAQLSDSVGVLRESGAIQVIPSQSALLPAYPNPFNPETWIPYHLAEASRVEVFIYSLSGALVRHLDLGMQAAGVYVSRERAIYWDGRNDFGERVSSGVYLIRFQAGDFSQIRKVVLRK